MAKAAPRSRGSGVRRPPRSSRSGPAPPLRATGIDAVGPAPWGTHFCQFYGTKGDLVEILVPYFKAGLEQDEFCMWITSPPLEAREAREALASAVPELEAYERRGRIEILPHTEWYLLGGSFDQDRVLKGWVDKLEAARARGCCGLRLSGNTFWLEKKDWKGFAEYEAAVDAVLGQYRMLALCTYSLDRCGAAEVADVVRNHQFALLKRDGRWELLESFDRRRMQDALAVERERLAVTLRSIGDAVIATDTQGRVTILNREAEDLTGFTQAEAVGRPLGEVFRVFEEGTEVRAEDPVRVVLERGAVSALGPDPVLVAKDGKRIAIDDSGAPILGDDGRAAGVVLVFRNVTTARRAEKAVRESEERYRQLFANLSEGFAVHEMVYDATGRACDYRFLEVNPAFERLTGLSREHTVGRTVLEVLPGLERSWIERYAAVVATGVPARFEQLAVALGRSYEVLAFRPRPGQFATLFFDVTERRRSVESREQLLARLRELQAATEAALRQAENGRQLMEAVMQALPVGVAITDSRGGTLQHNEAFDAIWRGPRPTARSLADYAAYKAWWADSGEEVRPEQWASSRAVATGEPVLGQVLRIRRFDGSDVFVLNSAAPVRDAGGKVVGSVVTIQDITDLREVDERKNEFLAVLSHELRNPLAPIRTSLYVLDHTPPGDTKAEHARAVIGRQVEQLARLVDDLLDVTRIARNKVQLRRARLDLNELAERARDDHRSTFEKSGVVLDLELPAVPSFVQGDPARLAQVIGNLLQNAAKFTPRGGRALLSVSPDPGGATASIRVVDSGVGMTEETVARLFEPFMQADKTLDRSKGGLGLGLALVKGLVELHGGTIAAHSAGLGKGAEFVLRLPLDAGERITSDAPPRRKASRRRVLVIEDNRDSAESLAAALGLAGHEVAVAYDGAEGLATARAFRPEAVLCDIGLPGMDGFEVARALKADDSLRGALLVALSGYARPEDLQRAAEAGFERHVAKPPDLDVLQALLAELPQDRVKAAPDAE